VGVVLAAWTTDVSGVGFGFAEAFLAARFLTGFGFAVDFFDFGLPARESAMLTYFMGAPDGSGYSAWMGSKVGMVMSAAVIALVVTVLAVFLWSVAFWDDGGLGESLDNAECSVNGGQLVTVDGETHCISTGVPAD